MFCLHNIYMCHACIWYMCMPGTQRRISDPLELQMVMSHHLGAGNKPEALMRANSIHCLATKPSVMT